MPKSLGQVIAAEAAARAGANKRGGSVHKQGQKPDLFEGFDRTYSAFAEADQGIDPRALQRPAEGKRVQLRADQVLAGFMEEMRQAIDLSLAKDAGNCNAFADLTVDGNVLVHQAPATWLLHMEKVMDDFMTFVSKIPVRDPAVEWREDPDAGVAHSDPEFTNSEEVRTVPLVVVAPTKEHPGQGVTVQERVAVGRWTRVRHTGALTEERKRELERRVEKLKTAFKEAREEANRVEVDEKHVAGDLFAYILGN